MISHLLFLSLLGLSSGFLPPYLARPTPYVVSGRTQLFSTEVELDAREFTLTLPMGLVIEDSDTGGVEVIEITDSGSAASQGDKIAVGDKVLSVGGTPCDSSDFDGVMGLIMAAAETGSVSLALGRPKGDDALSSGSGGGAPDAIPDGTVVKLTVIEKGADRVVEGKVGDNLRQVLLDNKVNLYNSMMKKMSNCGGGGQCLTCKVIVEPGTGAWPARSEYEEQKLKKFPDNVRLACMAVVEGEAKVEVEG